MREIYEEIGLKVKREDLDFWMVRRTHSTFENLINNEFYYVYFLKFDGDAEQLKLQTEELQKINFVPLNVLQKNLKEMPDKYVPHEKYWFEVVDEIQKKLLLPVW